MSTRRRPAKHTRNTRKYRKNKYQRGGGRGSVVGPISSLAQDWLNKIRNRFDELTRADEKDKESTERLMDSIPNYSVPFSEEPGLDYSIGKNDLRTWGVNIANTLNYNPERYTIRDFYMNISHKPVEFTKLTLPAYIELENTIRKNIGADASNSVTTANIGLPEMQPFYILAIMASVDKNRIQAPIVFSE
jgi:hypothetical protein